MATQLKPEILQDAINLSIASYGENLTSTNTSAPGWRLLSYGELGFSTGLLYSGDYLYSADIPQTVINAQAIVAVKDDTLSISFRGSQEAEDWIADIIAGLFVGFSYLYSFFAPLVDKVDSYLAANPSIKNVLVTGHSLGGVIAELFMDRHRGSGADLVGVTFGSPGAKLSDYGPLKYDPRLYNFSHNDDPIPNILPDSVNQGIEIGIERPDLNGLIGTEHFSANYKASVDRLSASEGWNRFIENPNDYNISLTPNDSRTFNSTDAKDFFLGGDQYDLMYGGSDWDILDGGNGDDSLYGGSGDDWLFGGDENDKLYGGIDADHLFGGEGKDTLSGEVGGDILNGGGRNDTLIGGKDIDHLSGGKGRDTFVATPGGGVDWIYDFQIGVDKIDLSKLIGTKTARDIKLVDGFGGVEVTLGSSGFFVVGVSSWMIRDDVTPAPVEEPVPSVKNFFFSVNYSPFVSWTAEPQPDNLMVRSLPPFPNRWQILGWGNQVPAEGTTFADGSSDLSKFWSSAWSGGDFLFTSRRAFEYDPVAHQYGVKLYELWLANDSIRLPSGNLGELWRQMRQSDVTINITGSGGNDNLDGSTAKGTVNATLMSGNDFLFLGDTPSGGTVLLGAGDDVLVGTVDSAFGEGGDDYISGARYMDGGPGADTYVTRWDTTIYMEDRLDRVVGEGRIITPLNFDFNPYVDQLGQSLPQGATVTLVGQAVFALGGPGGDRFYGNAQNNKLFGNDSDDVLYGSSGDDLLDGGPGDDYLNGGFGDDKLYLDSDYDHAIGGDGADKFYLSLGSTIAERTTRLGFEPGIDTVYLKRALFVALGDRVNSSEFNDGTRPVDANDFLIFDRNTHMLYYDRDGSGPLEKEKLITFYDNTNTTIATPLYSDFILV